MPFDNLYESPFGDLEILLDARSRIATPNRWVKRAFRDGDRHCLVAALSLACKSKSFDDPSETEHRLARLLAKQLPRKAGAWRYLVFLRARRRLVAFNDHHRTGHEDIMALFDQTIDRLHAKAAAPVVIAR
ncbi:MAG: hypothetical protein J2P31_12100 [Blastocatellia bacterium]|nr:hypothetical protein [Blastocatellia bacterium]